MRVLITDGEQRAALASVRALAAVGHDVTVTSQHRRCLAGASRHAARHVRVSPPASPSYHSAIASLVRELSIDAVLPITDASLLALLSERGAIGALIPFPSLQQVRAIGNKQLVMEAAERAGLARPAQWTVASPGAGSPAGASFPVVVKPHRSVVIVGGEQRHLRVGYAGDPAALARRLSELPAEAFPVLLQERVTGPGVGVFLLRWGGRTLASFSHRRLREKPPSGGVSVYRESIALNPDLRARAERLLDAFEWNGVAMVELKLDARSGTPYIMEINGRLWGSLQLAIDAGVNFPALLLDAATGRPTPGPPPYRLGVRSRWLWGDVDQLLSRLRRSRAALALPPDAPGRWRAVRDFLVSCTRTGEEEVFRWNDPGPFLRETIDWLRNA